MEEREKEKKGRKKKEENIDSSLIEDLRRVGVGPVVSTVNDKVEAVARQIHPGRYTACDSLEPLGSRPFRQLKTPVILLLFFFPFLSVLPVSGGVFKRPLSHLRRRVSPVPTLDLPTTLGDPQTSTLQLLLSVLYHLRTII